MFSRIQSKLQARGYWAEAPSTDSAGISGGSAVDRIADLLSGKPEEPAKPQIEEPEEDDTQPDDSNQDEDDADDEDSDEDIDYSNDSDEEVTWAKTLGVDEKNVVLDEEGNLSGINVKIDGKVSTVEIKDLIAGYQTNKSVTNRSKALAEERKDFDSIKVAVAQEYTKKIETVDRLTAHLKDTLLNEYKGVDWTRLRTENPGEYAAAVQDFNFRQSEIDRISSAVTEEKTGVQQQMTVEQQQQFNEYIKGEAEKIITKNPSWAKPEVFKKAIGEMTDFVNEEYGFSAQEFANVQDARVLEIVKDAMKYRNSLKSAKTKLNVVVPKFQKSTGKTVKTATKLDRLVKQAKEAKGYDKRAAETDAVAELLANL
jgi:hypothetical protein